MTDEIAIIRGRNVFRILAPPGSARVCSESSLRQAPRGYLIFRENSAYIRRG